MEYCSFKNIIFGRKPTAVRSEDGHIKYSFTVPFVHEIQS